VSEDCISGNEIYHFFVYGTLMRGQCREKCWPHPPMRVEAAVIQAALYDLHDYPAIAKGTGVVRGEVWELRPEHMAETLRVLDEVEGFAQREDDLFVRRMVYCKLDDGRELQAWAYYYARRAKLREKDHIPGGPTGWSGWGGNA
jgi:gamma-glutamylcyclotransferase (GGCT)/AIG2-like uncharacterized protein YtfP